jgi:hypothetical protein
MSALGQKQTFALQKAMSDLPLKADIYRRGFGEGSGGNSPNTRLNSSSPISCALV